MSALLRGSSRSVKTVYSSLNITEQSGSRYLRISPACRASLVAARRRTYATKQPEDGKERNSNPASEQKSGKPGKPAPGFENLYEQSSLNSQSKGSTKAQNDAVKVPPEDIKLLDDTIQSLKMALPGMLVKDLEPFLENCKRTGIPRDLRKPLTDARNAGGLSLSNAMKIMRLATKIVEQSQRGGNAAFSEKDEDSKDGKEDGTQQQQQQGQNSSGGGSGGPGGGPFKMLDTNTIIISLFTTYICFKLFAPSEASKDITWQEFNNAFLQKGLVEKLVVNDERRVKVYLHRESLRAQHPDSPAAINENFFYYFTIGSVEGFERKLDIAQEELGIPAWERIPVSYERGESSLVATLLVNILPTALLIGALFYMGRRSSGGGGGGGGIFGMGRSRAKKFNHESDVKVKFADVAGMDEAKTEIMEFVSFLKTPERFQKLGAKIPRGAILSGPPGTGKTLLAKATAGESAVPFFSVSGAEFVEIFVGVGPSRVRDLFANARKNTPCIIFIDEIDAIGRSRGGKNQFNGGNDEREATLNQILTEMDGFNTSEQVVVLAGTNRPDVLDSALMRPGRFDRHIAIDRPTMEGRKQIFAVHLKNIVTDEDIGHLTGRLAALTPGFSGADIANCANEAALIAARENADKVRMKHFEAAIERTIGGLEKKSLVLSPEEKRVVAYHEAGHAICGWFFKHADPLLKVSIIPRGQGALGYAQYLPGDTYLMNQLQFMDRMAMTLGGRVSEELHFETVTSGASDDFNKVTRMATAMVTKYGMSDKIGRVYYEDDGQQQLHKPFSEQTAREIDEEVKRIADAAYTQCKDLLTAKKKEIGLVAEELLKKEMLVRDDLIRILGKRPFEDKAEFEKYFNTGGNTPGQKSAPPPPPQEGTPFPGDAPQPAMKELGNDERKNL